jgi:hypothetical protein
MRMGKHSEPSGNESEAKSDSNIDIDVRGLRGLKKEMTRRINDLCILSISLNLFIFSTVKYEDNN